MQTAGTKHLSENVGTSSSYAACVVLSPFPIVFPAQRMVSTNKQSDSILYPTQMEKMDGEYEEFFIRYNLNHPQNSPKNNKM